MLDERLETGMLTTRAGYRQDHVRLADGEAGHRPDQCVHAFSGDESADAHHQGSVDRQAELATHRRPFAVVEGNKPVGVDARRNYEARQGFTGGTLGFGSGIAAGADDQRCATQHAPQEGSQDGQPARNRDLGAMQDDGIWHVDPWCSESDRNCRIPDHQFGTMIPGESAHPSGQPRVRKQPRFT